MMVSPKTPSMKNSGNENANTSGRTTGMSAIKTSVPIMAPRSEADAEMPIANPPRPCRVSGYPSSVVAALGDDPGTLSKIAVTEPQNVCPANAATKSPIAVAVSRL